MTSLFDLTTTQQKILTRNIAFFKELNLPFAILFPNGDVIGDLKIAESKPEEKKRLRNKSPYPRGSLRAYLLTVMNNLPVAKTIYLPAREFDLERLQGSAASLGYKKYGKGCVFTSQNLTLNQLEITRSF